MQMTMGREKQNEKGKGKRTGRLEIRRMENPIRRQITFSKRKAGLIKKAAELSLLCDVDVALIISSPSGKLFHSPAPNIDRTLERYQKCCASSDDYSAQKSESIELVHLELEDARKLKTKLEIKQKHMMGEDLDFLSYKELDLLEQKLEIGSRKMCSRKEKLFEEYIQSLVEKLKTRQLGRDQNDGEGLQNFTVDVIANYRQPDRHDGDLDHVANSETNLNLSLS